MTGKEVVGLFCALFAAALGKVAWEEWSRHRAEQQAVASVDQKMSQLRQDAVKNNPGVPVGEALRAEVSKQTNATLTSQAGDKATQTMSAAAQAMGFLVYGPRLEGEYCKALGVDVGAYVNAIARANHTEIERASAIMANAGASEAKMYALIEAQIRKLTDERMKETARDWKMGMPDVCKEIALNAEVYAERKRLSQVMPATAQVLMSTK